MPLPGMRGTDHIGITVPDLDEADDFFTRILGAERAHGRVQAALRDPGQRQRRGRGGRADRELRHRRADVHGPHRIVAGGVQPPPDPRVESIASIRSPLVSCTDWACW